MDSWKSFTLHPNHVVQIESNPPNTGFAKHGLFAFRCTEVADSPHTTGIMITRDNMNCFALSLAKNPGVCVIGKTHCHNVSSASRRALRLRPRSSCNRNGSLICCDSLRVEGGHDYLLVETVLFFDHESGVDGPRQAHDQAQGGDHKHEHTDVIVLVLRVHARKKNHALVRSTSTAI